jgi:hypothetical protein
VVFVKECPLHQWLQLCLSRSVHCNNGFNLESGGER